MSVSTMLEAPIQGLVELGLQTTGPIHYQLNPNELSEQALQRNEAELNDTGALVIKTGNFTGRSPKDKFTVKDEITTDTVDWNDFNIPIDEKYFFQLKDKMMAYLSSKELWVRDCFACADEQYRLSLRVINESPANNLFCYNMFIRPSADQLKNFAPHWHIIQAPGFKDYQRP